FEPSPGEAPDVSAARPGGALHPSHRPSEFAQTDRCLSCHNLPGVFSFNTYTQVFAGPGDAPAGPSVVTPSAALASAVAWKRTRADWILLQRLLRGPAMPRR